MALLHIFTRTVVIWNLEFWIAYLNLKLTADSGLPTADHPWHITLLSLPTCTR